MADPNLIIPYCCMSGRYCSSNNLFIEGYALGVSSLMIVLAIVELINLICICKNHRNVKSVEEDGPVEVSDLSSEDNPKDDEQKKDD